MMGASRLSVLVVGVDTTVLLLKKGMKLFIEGRKDAGGVAAVTSFPAAAAAAAVLSIWVRNALEVSRSFFNNSINSSLFDAALFNFSRKV